MHLTLLLAGALMPTPLAAALAESLKTPVLKRRLEHATALVGSTQSSSEAGTSGHLVWLAQNLMKQSTPATAPYAFRNLSGGAQTAYVWHADPVHVEVARDQLVVQALDSDALTDDEAVELVTLANQVLSPFDVELVIRGSRWFLLHEFDWIVETIPLVTALDSPVTMPVGPDAAMWNRLHNEIQMAWHAHEVNEQREATGKRTVNALWLYGGGRYHPLPAIAFSEVHSNASEWRGVAEAAGSRGHFLNDTVASDALIVIDDLLIPKQREDWAAWLQMIAAIDARVARYDAAALDIVLTGKSVKTFSSRGSDRYRFWRGRGLSEALSE